MNILKPGFVYIDNLCFRRNFAPDLSEFISDTNFEQDEDYLEKENTADNYDDLIEEDYNIEFVNGKYVYSFSVPLPCLAFIIGAHGVMKKKIESQTKTTLIVPKKYEGNSIKITGDTKSAIMSARTRIMLIVTSSRFKLKATHFLSVHICGEKLVSNYTSFMDDLIKNFKVAKELFQTAEKLHLTIGMLHLLDVDDMVTVGQICQQAKTRLNNLGILNDPLKVNIKGLEYMNDDPSRVNVLYAKIDPQYQGDNRLQIICDELVDLFVEKGFLKKDHDRVKLHITIMNSRYSQNVRDFDIIEIMKKHKDYEFGEIAIDKVYITERHSTDAKTKFFKTSHFIQF